MRLTDRLSPAARVAAVLLGIGLCGAVCLAETPSGRLVVGDVLVRGNRRVPAQAITARLRTKPGTEYSDFAVQEDVRALYATKQFGNVRATRENTGNDRVNVTFHVVEYQNLVSEVIFQGAKSLNQKELEELTGIRAGTPLNPVANQIACQSIVQRYNEKGRPFASCTLLEGANDGDARVVFAITEGPQVFIRDISFEGNHFVSDAVLNTHVNSSERLLGIHLLSKPYVPAVADNDVAQLIEYYRSFGYHDVRVSRQVEWDASARTVDLTFYIDEGTRYRVKGPPQLVGVKAFKEEELGRLCETRPGDYYNQKKIDRDVATLKDYYGYVGRQAAVQDRVYYTGPGICTVQYEVAERPPDRVGDIYVIGNTTTRQNVILRQVPLYPGQLLSYPALREAERNLARLGIFEVSSETSVRPQVTVLNPESPNPYKDVLVTVQETRTGSLLFGVGVNSDAGFTGSIVLNERNFDLFRPPTSLNDLLSGNAFRGGGQELRVEAIPGTELQRYTFTFREPYLFDSDYGLTVSGYYYTRAFLEYDEERLGSRVSLSRRLNDTLTATGTVRVENVDVQQVPFFAPIDYQSVVGDNFQVGFRAALTWDQRDSYLRPTEGYILDLSLEQVVGDRDFPIFVADYNKYLTVWERPDGSGRHVLALHSQFGYAGDNTPVFERFYAGGFRSLRGFAFRGVGPDINGFKVGGQFIFLNSVEYQVPVLANDNVYVVGFVDSGTVERDLDINDYRVSAGFGVRFIVPMLGPVPIALDFGFPIVQADRDDEQVFSFWMGFFR